MRPGSKFCGKHPKRGIVTWTQGETCPVCESLELYDELLADSLEYIGKKREELLSMPNP